jgi:carboxymethylenebutenolidase
VVNYGALPTDPNDLQQIAAPILGNFGAQDHGITPADVKAFQKSMTGIGRYVDIKIYDDAGHAFENPNNHNPPGYRPEDAADAWARTVAFLKKALR